MKKARIALSAIALFAVVGGAFAFKAVRTQRILAVPAPNGQCTSTVLTSASIRPNGPFVGQFSTTTTTATCPLTSYVTLQ